MLGCAAYPVSFTVVVILRYIYFTYRSIIVYLTECTHGSIRLRGGTSTMNGRVEVCLNGDWGTVCHDHWSTVDANVACQQLGYSRSGMKGGKGCKDLR